MKFIPLVYHPTSILWVDDDLLFLETIEKIFKGKYNLMTYDSPIKCLDFMQSNVSCIEAISTLKPCDTHELIDLKDHLPVDINIKNIWKYSENSIKTQEISVMIIDQNMPEMNGIELCRRLSHLPIKKILLTGESNYEQAIKAFNENIIDCFIQKDSENLELELIHHITNLTDLYFSSTTKNLIQHIESGVKLHLTDPIFISHFKKLIQQKNITEYYLMDKMGSFFIKDKYGNSYYLIVHTNRSLSEFKDIYSEDNDIKNFINSCLEKNLIPYFGPDKEAWEFDLSNWKCFFHESQELIGREKYYFTIINSMEFDKNNVAA